MPRPGRRALKARVWTQPPRPPEPGRPVPVRRNLTPAELTVVAQAFGMAHWRELLALAPKSEPMDRAG